MTKVYRCLSLILAIVVRSAHTSGETCPVYTTTACAFNFSSGTCGRLRFLNLSQCGDVCVSNALVSNLCLWLGNYSYVTEAYACVDRSELAMGRVVLLTCNSEAYEVLFDVYITGI